MENLNIVESTLETITRLEIINHQDGTGREYVKYNCEKIELSIQDEGRTLKIFLSSSKLKDNDSRPD